MPQNNSVQVFEGGWKELENALFTDNQANIATLPESHFVRPDGTSVSVISGTVIETFPIGLPRYDPDQVGALSDTFTITDDATPIGHCWNNNGTELYFVGQTTKTLYQFNVPTPYTPSSIIAASVSLDLVDVALDPLQVVISRDGDFIFITDGDSVYSFPLPTPDDITSNVSNTVFTPGGGVNVDSFAVKLEGDKFYFGDIANNIIREYVATSPNIIVGATANGNTFTLPEVVAASGPLEPFSITFRSNGKQLFVLERTDNVFVRCHLDNINWNISTASYFPNFLASSGYQSVFWKPDGTKLFALNSGGGDRIDEFTLDDRWNMNEGTITFNFALAGIAESPRGIWVSSDGLTCFVVDSTTDDIVQLDMSTGWDLSTMTDPLIRFDLTIRTNINNPSGVAFSKDQLTYYVCGSGTDDVFQYTVTSPLDITTSAFSGNSLDLSGMGDLADIRLRPDDNLMYVCTRNADFVRLFSLPPDGNVSNAVFLQELNVEAQEDNLQGFFIRENDGKKMWLVGLNAGGISCMDMTLEFNNALITSFGEEITTDAGVTIVKQ